MWSVIGPYLVLLMFSSGLCDSCVTYNFEEDFDTKFTSESNICGTFINSWFLNDFISLNMESPNPLSTMFISPTSMPSCVSSFHFPMPVGRLELNVYMENVQPADYINTLIMDSTGGSITNMVYNLGANNFKQGWNNLNIPSTGSPTGIGFIVLMGSSSVGSVVLVDSFRYIPPTLNEDDEECEIYPENISPPTDSEEDTSTTVTESWATETTDSSDPDTGSTVTESYATESTDISDADTGSTVTESYATESTDISDADTGSTVTESYATESTDSSDLDTGSTVTESYATESTDSSDPDTGSTVTESYATESTGSSDPDTGSTVTESYATESTDSSDSDTGSTVTESYATESTDSSDPDTGSTVTESYETESTDSSDPDTGSTVTESYATESTFSSDPDTGSTVTESYATESTDSGDQNTASTVTESYATESTYSSDQDTASTVAGTWTTAGDETTTTEPGESPGEDIVTPAPSTEGSGFWNAITITMVTVILAIVLIFICMVFYQIGKRKAEKQVQPVIIPEVDYNNLPKSLTVPRVNTVYSDVGLNPFRNSALQV